MHSSEVSAGLRLLQCPPVLDFTEKEAVQTQDLSSKKTLQVTRVSTVYKIQLRVTWF
jgi:hypothetical protein